MAVDLKEMTIAELKGGRAIMAAGLKAAQSMTDLQDPRPDAKVLINMIPTLEVSLALYDEEIARRLSGQKQVLDS